MTDRPSSQLTFLLLWLSGGFFRPPSVRILQLLSCPFPFLPLVDPPPPPLTVSCYQSTSVRRLSPGGSAEDDRQNDGVVTSPSKGLIAAQQGPFHSPTPRSEGRLIPYDDSQEWGWKPTSDRMACLFLETISAVHSVAFEANLMRIRPVCL